MYCSKCGTQGKENAKFCESCGEVIASAKVPSQIQSSIPTMNQYSNQSTYQEQASNQKPKKKTGCIVGGCLITILLGVILLAIVGIWAFSDDSSESTEVEIWEENEGAQEVTQGIEFSEPVVIEGMRELYTIPKGDGTDINTIMVYLIGSDLESEIGAATEDIYEMLDADLGDNINLILMTGGAYEWYHDDISNETCQYWQVIDGELVLLEDNLGMLDMTAPDTLINFINETATNFPADRYSLIMWDHGGGTFGGFGYDELYGSEMMTLESLEYVFEQSQVYFDFVGFDACLMATVEIAVMLEPYADYLIASQELEPGSGWYYTDWLTTFGENPSMSTIELGTHIIDDFVTYCTDYIHNPQATLSITELRAIPYAYDMLSNYFTGATEDIYNDEYPRYSQARVNAKSFGENDYEQIDIVDYITKADSEGAAEAIAALNNAVKYYSNSYDVQDAYGLAMYFPYDYPDYYEGMQDSLHEVGFDEEYTQFFDTFVSAMYGGQLNYDFDFFGQEDGAIEDDYSEYDWYDSDAADFYAEEYDSTTFEDLIIDEKGDGYVLSLSDEQWEAINTIELQVLLDDEEGYIDLGSDNVYEFDEDGDLIVDFDNTWVTLDGNTVAYYFEEEVVYDDGSWYTYGSVPAILNEEEYIEVIVYWDSDYPEGYVAGYRKYTETGEPAGKGFFDFEVGDMIEWVFDYYTYDGEYDDYYIIGDPYIYGGNEIVVSYDDVGDFESMIYFKLTDVFNNIYETEALFITYY